MKLRSFGKLFSLVAVLVLIFSLTCAMAITANAEDIDVLSSEGEMTITVTAPYKECGKIKLSWDKVIGADKYAVYCNEEHLANSVVTYYSVGSLDVAAHGDSEIPYSFKVVALDKQGNALSYGTVQAAAKHNYNDVVTDATCTTDGYTTHTCACGDEYVDAHVDALGHDYGEWIEIVEALCLTDGVLGHYTCSRCSLDFDAEFEILESLTIPALGHSFTNHTYNGDATCLADGTKTALCDNGCGESETLTAVGTALGHSFTNHTYNGDATCLADGTKTALCDNGCGESETLTAVGTALGHSFTNYEFNNDATCTTDGSSTAICDNGCGAKDTIGTPGTATGHYPLPEVVENHVAPDCVTPGSEDRVVYCSACDAEVSRQNFTLDPLGHTDMDPVVENHVAPDCVTPGSEDRVVYCSVCDAEVSRQNFTFDPLGHTEYSEVENYNAPDCVTPGSQDNVVYCSVCNVEVSRENVTLDPLGHTKGANKVENYNAPDCLNPGSKDNVSYCTVCGVEVSRQNVTIDPTGHSFTEYVSDGDATCFEDGHKTATCDNGCGATETVLDEGSTLAHELELENNPDAFVLYLYCAHCGGEKQFGKVQIPVPYRMPLLKGSVVLVCILIIIGSIRALTRPATTTPFWKRRRY